MSVTMKATFLLLSSVWHSHGSFMGMGTSLRFTTKRSGFRMTNLYNTIFIMKINCFVRTASTTDATDGECEWAKLYKPFRVLATQVASPAVSCAYRLSGCLIYYNPNYWYMGGLPYSG